MVVCLYVSKNNIIVRSVICGRIAWYLFLKGNTSNYCIMTIVFNYLNKCGNNYKHRAVFSLSQTFILYYIQCSKIITSLRTNTGVTMTLSRFYVAPDSFSYGDSLNCCVGGDRGLVCCLWKELTTPYLIRVFFFIRYSNESLFFPYHNDLRFLEVITY